MSPDEVHETGPERVERLHAQMDAILKEIGYTQGSVGERMQALARIRSTRSAEGDTGRAEIMAFIDERLDWIKAQMPRAFNTVVNPNMEVKRLPPEEEPGAPGAYGGAGSIDGKIPGRYWINLRTTELHSKYSLADLTFHESIPGHIWQGEYTHGSRSSASCCRSTRSRKAGASTPNNSPTNSARTRTIASDGSATCSHWRSAPAASSSTPGSTPRGGRASGACSSSSTRTGRTRGKWRAKSIGTVRGRAGVRLQGRAHRDQPAAATRPRRRSASRYDLKAFDDTVVRGGNVPLDVLGRNVDEYVRTA